MDDCQLLRQFVEHDSQQAFAALTGRYLSLVYSTCRRELDDAETAEDVTQAVFLILARKAPTLRRSVVLSGWLFQTARFAAKNARLQSQRRSTYEQKAAEEMGQQQGPEDAVWAEIEPVLNQSLGALGEGERDCVLLRFFQQMSFAEAGMALGLSEEAARKRVTRALEKIRRFFEKHGVAVPAVALAVLLTAHAAKAAPPGLLPALTGITNGMVTGSAGVSLLSPQVSQLTEGVLHAMKIASLKMAAGIAALALVGTAATYGVVRGAAPAVPAVPPADAPHATTPVSAVTSDLIKRMIADTVAPTQYRTVALTGKVLRADGVTAGGVHVAARVRDSFEKKLWGPHSGAASQAIMFKSGSLTHTQPDGTYTLYVGADLGYYVYVAAADIMASNPPDTGLVAVAAESVPSARGVTVHVSDLILIPGGFITGTVTDEAGKPVPGVSVASAGPISEPHRPVSSLVLTDAQGRYRLRVAPGQSRPYMADIRYKDCGLELGTTVTVAEGETKSVNFQVTPAKL